MKDLLDRGCVKASWLDREFFRFLDLKEEYGREFILRLKEHVEATGEWGNLAKFESERRKHAKMFVDEVGMMYWGTPTNRQKYLVEEALEDKTGGCVYPDHRDELVRTIMILLERKAKSYSRPSLSTEKPTPGSYIPNHPDRKAKRKSNLIAVDDEEYTDSVSSKEKKPTFKTPRTRAIARAIKPFKDIISSESESDSDSSSMKRTRASTKTKKPTPTKKASQAVEVKVPKPTPQPPSIPPPKPKKNGSSPVKNPPLHAKPSPKAVVRENRAGETMFLVTASTQEGMAAVWVPYVDFAQADDFLEHMAMQCDMVEWSPTAQLSRENSMEYTPSATTVTIAAASIKFEWSDFEIRVRRAHAQDWKLVKRELQKAWRAEGPENAFVTSFKIRVKLHCMITA
ncbi:hypothetical protein BO71DRAFT_363808 [Aspergillus ellipticus CBS 707.79]|uniref:Uncharacterized protein n=1 Tax=Aspergillus ellipticus CBS 707.79 TaxID=1448320 RepID=A0A319DMB3_9EURO|nr:hypothetical protein BO71DRAFT_363808 [Aspergillus ellipticus CBS 707.79]